MKKRLKQRFGIVGGETGIVSTRTGRRFFADCELEAQLLARIRAAMDASGFWTQFNTDWACLDCELMPWSVKAQELLRSQYAAVGASGRASLPKAVAALRQAAERWPAKRNLRPALVSRPTHRMSVACSINTSTEARRLSSLSAPIGSIAGRSSLWTI